MGIAHKLKRLKELSSDVASSSVKKVASLTLDEKDVSEDALKNFYQMIKKLAQLLFVLGKSVTKAFLEIASYMSELKEKSNEEIEDAIKNSSNANRRRAAEMIKEMRERKSQ